MEKQNSNLFQEVRIALIREGASLEKLAERLGISRQYLSAALKGKTNGESAKRICEKAKADLRIDG